MADFVNPSTLELAASQSAKPAPWVVCTRVNLETWSLIPQAYRKWVIDHVEEMTAQEKAIVDAAVTAAREAALITSYDQTSIEKAVALVIKDELNLHTAATNALLAAVAAATSLADLKTRCASISTLSPRTTQNIKTALQAKLAQLDGG